MTSDTMGRLCTEPTGVLRCKSTVCGLHLRALPIEERSPCRITLFGRHCWIFAALIFESFGLKTVREKTRGVAGEKLRPCGSNHLCVHAKLCGDHHTRKRSSVSA